MKSIDVWGASLRGSPRVHIMCQNKEFVLKRDLRCTGGWVKLMRTLISIGAPKQENAKRA